MSRGDIVWVAAGALLVACGGATDASPPSDFDSAIRAAIAATDADDRNTHLDRAKSLLPLEPGIPCDTLRSLADAAGGWVDDNARRAIHMLGYECPEVALTERRVPVLQYLRAQFLGGKDSCRHCCRSSLLS